MVTITRSKARRKYPYYKVQVRNEISMAWKDEKAIFDNLDEANKYVASQMFRDKVIRIMVIEEKRRYPLEAV